MVEYDEPVRELSDIREATRFMVHSAVTLIHENADIIFPGQTHKRDKELIQLAADWPMHQTPIPEGYFRKAFREMEDKCVASARRAGLLKP